MPPCRCASRNHLQRDGRLARRFRPEDLDHAAAGEAADAQRGVERNGAGGDDGDRDNRPLAPQLHDGALTELLFDLRAIVRSIARLFSVFSSAMSAAPWLFGPGTAPVQGNRKI